MADLCQSTATRSRKLPRKFQAFASLQRYLDNPTRPNWKAFCIERLVEASYNVSKDASTDKLAEYFRAQSCLLKAQSSPAPVGRKEGVLC